LWKVNELKEKNIDQKAYMTLKTSFTEVEKRCVKHQKSEVEVKRQLAGYQSFINDLQREIHELTERLSAGAEEYKTLFRKYTLLQQSVEINEKQETTVDTTNEPVYKEDELFAILHNSYEGKQQQQEQEQEPEPVPEPEPELELELEPQVQSNRSSLAEIDQEVQTCPMCSWTFPVHMSLDGKREHIENHFQ
jgi:chromosome segregation ATPase